MKIIAIANRKGGCGKTTTAINLAAGLGARDSRVLLLDLDPQGHASLGLNAVREDARDLHYVLTRLGKLEDIIVAEAFPNLDVVPATPMLAALEHEAWEHDERDRLLEQPLASIRDRYDYAVVDCPSSLGLLALNALGVADLVLIPIEMSRFGLAGIERMYETVALLRARAEREIPVRVLPTLVDTRTRLCRHFLRELWTRFAEDVLPGGVLFTVRLREAVHKGLPISAYDPASPAAAQYEALAEEVVALLRGQRVAPSPNEQMTAIEHALAEARRRSSAEGDPRRRVVLRFPGYGGKVVQLAGDFNNWEPDLDVATRITGHTVEKIVMLHPGIYQYRLIVDGEWCDDASNPDRVRNLAGGFNSRLRVVEEEAQAVDV